MVETNEGSEKDSGPSTSQALDDEPPGAKRRKVIAPYNLWYLVGYIPPLPKLMPPAVSHSILL